MQLTMEYQWHEKVYVIEEIDGTVYGNWAAHHALKKRSPTFEVSITPLLHLLQDQNLLCTTARHMQYEI